MSRTKTILLGFILIILTGTALLLLPFSTRSGESTSLLGALFTAVSSTCVTGLVVYDTWSHWTLFGQLVLLCLIQIGGLGFITIGTFFMILLGKKIGLSRRTLIQESLSTLQIKGSVRLIKRIIAGTLLFEGVGALLLSLRFIPKLGMLRGLYYSLFHSVSAFCNAGFDLMGYTEAYSSFSSLYNEPLVVLVLSALILIGGLGFIVWEDLLENKWHWRKYSFQTKAVLTTSLVLVAGGSLLYLLFERKGLFADMSLKDKLLNALFCAVSPRTAGFNTVDLSKLSDSSYLTTLFLMFVGGSPGSTAGGVKTTAIFAVALYLKAYLLREKDCVAFHRRMDDDSVKKAVVVLFINLCLALVGGLIILSVQNLPLKDVLFEVFSAGGTVGMSTGITRELNTVSQAVIMLLMFCGRMGSLTFAMSFTEDKSSASIRYPLEDIVIG